jgi:hypothetical protein
MRALSRSSTRHAEEADKVVFKLPSHPFSVLNSMAAALPAQAAMTAALTVRRIRR